MDEAWIAEAAGIAPWPGAQGIRLDAPHLRVRCAGPLLSGRWLAHSGKGRVRAVHAVLDLEDADTLAAFDRRLALRLGAPEAAVREGVTFGRVPDGSGGRDATAQPLWRLTAGRDWTFYYEPGDMCAWEWEQEIDTDDELLARCRAWKSVPG